LLGFISFDRFMLFAAADLQLKRVLGKGGFGEHLSLLSG
jgi:hypothetical protein